MVDRLKKTAFEERVFSFDFEERMQDSDTLDTITDIVIVNQGLVPSSSDVTYSNDTIVGGTVVNAEFAGGTTGELFLVTCQVTTTLGEVLELSGFLEIEPPATSLVVEDGTGLDNANSYVSLAEANQYFSQARVANATWNTTTNDQKEAALRMATMVLDQDVQWRGEKRYEDGALRWPRNCVYDDDGVLVANDSVPRPIRYATSEMALWLLSQDRFVERSGIGLKYLRVDVIEMEFDKFDKADLVPSFIRRMLTEYGTVFSNDAIRTRKLHRA